MSNFNIEIIDVTAPQHAPGKNGGYNFVEVTYKSNGKVDGKKIVDFNNKDVYETLKNSKKGDTFEISSEKDKKGYWQWVGVGVASAASDSGGSGTQSSGSGNSVKVVSGRDFETADERAKKQAAIISQAMINSAIEFLGKNEQTTIEEVLSVASQFEDYIYAKLEERAQKYYLLSSQESSEKA